MRERRFKACWMPVPMAAFRGASRGISIHLVDADYDTGAIVRQCRVPVFRGDSLDDLKARVRAREKEFVIETLGQIAKGEIHLVAGAG
jgi:folate-dependent phosphoribosylglycinamide formyltransferase PurN